ncbi:DsbA family oxidoreductase [Oerskovia sp. Sa1BUA8]|uniref:DsbA family oxidoreductase n=1 Tax=Oerskovia douganii TaxID=2762210 RepID=A0A9D5UB28_9CELL|nr:DsbA family oxidoreductase [Oerskovia douganii]MBE7701610.1 DsbA family oxidoreductase [Oerskovia douganii]
MSEKVKVDIWSDVACPWCYVGKRRFETALAGFSGREDAPEVEIEYHSFELAPDTPVDFEGTEVDFLAKHKGMPAGQVEQMLGQMTTVAAAEGLAYDFDALQHTKTLKAHELLHFAKSRGKQVEMKERLLKAYFEQGRHVGRIDELAALATDVGLDADEVRAALESGEFEDAVEQDIEQARAYGISGVPFFVFNGRYGVSGAQDPAVFTQVLDQVVADAAESVA